MDEKHCFYEPMRKMGEYIFTLQQERNSTYIIHDKSKKQTITNECEICSMGHRSRL